MKKLVLVAAFVLAACGQPAPPAEHGYGADPQLPAPQEGMLPTVTTAEAVGWPDGAAPVAPEGFTVTRYAENLDHPRWIYRLPNGDVLVAESSTKPQENGGLMGWIRNRIQRSAGALGESADRITLLRDSDGDGVVDARHVFAEDLNQPFGIALVGEYLYVGNTDAVVRFRYTPNSVRAPGRPETLFELPYRDGDNGHWTRNIVANADGSKLYVAVGSASNIADHGLEAEEGRAAIWEFNPDGSQVRIFASGLRNPVGMSWEPTTNQLWVAVNERDMLGDNLVPDYITHVEAGAFYGWPYYYWGDHRDERVEIPANVRLQAPTAPDFALGAHTASLGLMFATDAALPQHYRGGAFVGQHGSWNRSELVGYRVAYVPFADGRPVGGVEDFLTGFLNSENQAQGRPVGVATDRTGAILVADDVGNIIWRVAYASTPAAPAQ
ncbi:MAG: sorbosone dehydrogenase family protein [Hyphomonadaceae bacterium]|nr:sorbosone dehydrogenase family protein [Hyphomonadaceae bacterium]